MKKTNTMLWLTDYAPLIVPAFPMAVVSLATYFFVLDAGLHQAIAATIAAIAAVAIELAGISSFRTLTGVYQSFKHNHQDGFVALDSRNVSHCHSRIAAGGLNQCPTRLELPCLLCVADDSQHRSIFQTQGVHELAFGVDLPFSSKSLKPQKRCIANHLGNIAVELHSLPLLSGASTATVSNGTPLVTRHSY